VKIRFAALKGPLFHGDTVIVEAKCERRSTIAFNSLLSLSVRAARAFFCFLTPALLLGRSQGTLITVGGSNPGLSCQARREVAVNFTTD
jgi:hypothetical protein